MRPEAELALLRTAQEALANVAKHAAATRVDLRLSFLADDVVLEVRDDGRGFDPAPAGSREPAYAASLAGDPAGGATGDPPDHAPDNGAGPGSASGDAASGGFGLVAMRQRIEGVSGTLRVESEPGAGTAISASVPAQPTEAAGETA